MIVLLAATNGAWLYAWNQYDYTSTQTEVNADNGTANYIGRDGHINNGKNNSKDENQD